MLEQRVSKLEDVLGRIEQRLTGIEAEIKHLPKATDYTSIKTDIARVDGRLSGIEARFAALPTTWTLLGIVFTTWALGSGILIFAMNFLKR